MLALQVVAVVALIVIGSLIVWGEVRWPVVLGGLLGLGIFLYASRRNARVERAFGRDPGPPEP